MRPIFEDQKNHFLSELTLDPENIPACRPSGTEQTSHARFRQ